MKLKAKKRRLAGRIADWEKNLQKLNDSKAGIAYHKPGSMKK